MKCKICGISFLGKMLHRTNPTGQPGAGWMCIDCLEKKEPELAKNIKLEGYPVLKEIENFVKN